VTRPRAADNFPMIRSRMEELRRERDHVVADPKGPSPFGPRPDPSTRNGVEHRGDRDLPRSMRRSFLR
jgi:hypothetical protein